MSMTETTQAPARKHKRANKRKAAAAPKKPASELAGLTVNDCCSACNVNGCVISGRSYCAHPFKGGLQGPDLGKIDAIGRIEAAKKLLGKRKVQLDGL